MTNKYFGHTEHDERILVHSDTIHTSLIDVAAHLDEPFVLVNCDKQDVVKIYERYYSAADIQENHKFIVINDGTCTRSTTSLKKLLKL